jgi:hypothetical protein
VYEALSYSTGIAIIVRDQLWGLIIGHHQVPKAISYHMRMAGDFLAQALSMRITALLDKENHELHRATLDLHVKLCDLMAAQVHALLAADLLYLQAVRPYGCAGACALSVDMLCSLLTCVTCCGPVCSLSADMLYSLLSCFTCAHSRALLAATLGLHVRLWDVMAARAYALSADMLYSPADLLYLLPLSCVTCCYVWL